MFGDDWPIGTLEPPDAIIGVHRHHERVALRTRELQQIQMAGMQEIKTAAGERDPSAAHATVGNDGQEV